MGLVGQRRLLVGLACAGCRHRPSAARRPLSIGSAAGPWEAARSMRRHVRGRRGRDCDSLATAPVDAREPGAPGRWPPMATVMVPCGWLPRSGETLGMSGSRHPRGVPASMGTATRAGPSARAPTTCCPGARLSRCSIGRSRSGDRGPASALAVAATSCPKASGPMATASSQVHTVSARTTVSSPLWSTRPATSSTASSRHTGAGLRVRPREDDHVDRALQVLQRRHGHRLAVPRDDPADGHDHAAHHDALLVERLADVARPGVDVATHLRRPARRGDGPRGTGRAAPSPSAAARGTVPRSGSAAAAPSAPRRASSAPIRSKSERWPVSRSRACAWP